jgi:hypothetical protein
MKITRAGLESLVRPQLAHVEEDLQTAVIEYCITLTGYVEEELKARKIGDKLLEEGRELVRVTVEPRLFRPAEVYAVTILGNLWIHGEKYMVYLRVA